MPECEGRCSVTEQAVTRAPALDWASIGWCNQTDARDCIRIYARLGLHPILLHGMRDGQCTCHKEHPVKMRPDGSQSSSAGKHPVVKGWQFAQLDLDAMYWELRRQPFYNVGLRMGRQPDGAFLVALDLDGPRGLIADLEAQYGRLPDTLTAQTPRGTHFIYRWNENRPKPKNQASLIADHFDVRSAGGQIAVAPSRHFSGGPYRWIDAREPAVFP